MRIWWCEGWRSLCRWLRYRGCWAQKVTEAQQIPVTWRHQAFLTHWTWSGHKKKMWYQRWPQCIWRQGGNSSSCVHFRPWVFQTNGRGSQRWRTQFGKDVRSQTFNSPLFIEVDRAPPLKGSWPHCLHFVSQLYSWGTWERGCSAKAAAFTLNRFRSKPAASKLSVWHR